MKIKKIKNNKYKRKIKGMIKSIIKQNKRLLMMKKIKKEQVKKIKIIKMTIQFQKILKCNKQNILKKVN